MAVKSTTVYTTSDGSKFLSADKASAHEVAYLATLVDEAHKKLVEVGFTDEQIRMAWDYNGELTAFFVAQANYEKL